MRQPLSFMELSFCQRIDVILRVLTIFGGRRLPNITFSARSRRVKKIATLRVDQTYRDWGIWSELYTAGKRSVHQEDLTTERLFVVCFVDSLNAPQTRFVVENDLHYRAHVLAEPLHALVRLFFVLREQLHALCQCFVTLG